MIFRFPSLATSLNALLMGNSKVPERTTAKFEHTSSIKIFTISLFVNSHLTYMMTW